MKRFVLVSCALVVASTMAQAQSVEGEISRAVLAGSKGDGGRCDGRSSGG